MAHREGKAGRHKARPELPVLPCYREGKFPTPQPKQVQASTAHIEMTERHNGRGGTRHILTAYTLCYSSCMSVLQRLL